jgi:DNA-binding winged helix-turn-helix (wHTH) protein/TolB-like protein
MRQKTEYKPIDLAHEAGFQLGDIRVSPATREVIVGGQSEIFEPRVLQVLVALARRRGEVVSREELSARCWKGRTVGDDALNRCIAHLRRLADATGDFKVETIPRIGYRLTTGNPVAAPPPDASPKQFPRNRWARFNSKAAFALLFAVISVLAVGGYFAVRSSSRSIVGPLEVHTYIVLPFSALNDDPELRHFAQSIAVSITHVLSQAGRRVISPAQAENFRGVDRARVTEATGARYIVDGEVWRDGNVTRVVVRVDDGRTGRTLMSNSFERDIAETAGLADVVAGYVGVRSWTYTTAIHSEHAEVEDAHFRLAELLVNGDSRAGYDLTADIARKYPDDAAALMMLASTSAFNYWALQQDEVAPAMQAARAAARRVTELVPHYGDAYIPLTRLLPPQRWAEREDLLRKGVRIDPTTSGSAGFLAQLLAEVGRLRDAELLARGIVGNDPFNTEEVLRHFLILQTLGNRTDAAALMEFGDRYLPGNPGFTLQRFMASDFRAAAPEAASMMANPSMAAIIEPPERQPDIRHMLRALESRRIADADAAVEGCKRGWVSTQTTTICLVGLSSLGRLDDAFALASANYSDIRAATAALEDERWLRREGVVSDTIVLYRAELAPMRADRRFIALAERIRLLDYWRAVHPPDFCETERAPVCQAIRTLGNP